MKNVLFATTALVAMAGSAMAASHGSNISLDWSGDFEAGYNDDVENGAFGSASLGLDVTVDFGDSVVGSVGIDFDSAGAIVSYIQFEYDSGSSLSALLRFGDLNDEGASERYYADRDGMALDVENHDSTNDIVAEVTFGSISVAAGCQIDTVAPAGACLGYNVGAGATFGSIELGLGYDDSANAGGQRTAVSADTTFGSFDVGASYITNGTDNSIGVEVGGTFGAIEVGVYYASNSAAANAYGVSADYSAGALTIGVYYDNDGANSYGVDLGYAITDSLTANAGYFNGTADVLSVNGTVTTATTSGFYYVGVDYAVNDNISATLSYATANEFGAPEYKQGITALITAEF